jgi:multicomponent Na+:H+ antiporter subunit B
MIDIVTNITLLAFLAITSVAIVRMTNLFAIVMLFGIFSLLSAGLFVVMDAPDVAFTEAAVGAGISTVLMLATLALVKRPQKPYYAEAPRAHRPWLPLVVVAVTGSALVYGTWDIPGFGAPVRHLGHPGVWCSRCASSDTCCALLHRKCAAGNRRAEYRHRGAG